MSQTARSGEESGRGLERIETHGQTKYVARNQLGGVPQGTGTSRTPAPGAPSGLDGRQHESYELSWVLQLLLLSCCGRSWDDRRLSSMWPCVRRGW